VIWNAETLTVQSEEELVEAVINLKRKHHLLIIGSGSIVASLTKNRLIDEYHLFVNPLILGKGKPLFKNIGDKSTFNFTSAKAFENGVVLLAYNI
jgi:dihydrofolate reductase